MLTVIVASGDALSPSASAAANQVRALRFNSRPFEWKSARDPWSCEALIATTTATAPSHDNGTRSPRPTSTSNAATSTE